MTTALPQNEHRTLNDLASTYDNFEFDAVMRTYMFRTLDPFLRPGRALELGCSYGDATTLLAERYRDLTVVDAADEFLDRARARIAGQGTFVNALFEEFQHLADPVAVLQRYRQYLSPGGRFYLVVPNGSAPSRQIAVKMGLLPQLSALTAADTKHGHRRTYFLDTLEAEARAAGLRVVSRGGIFFKALANYQIDRALAAKVITPEYMEGCYQLGMEHPQLCASIYLVCEAG
jgi:SAM-dependent methyltransferase